MKKIFSICIAMLLGVVFMADTVSAQLLSDPSKTYFNSNWQQNLPKITTRDVSNYNVGNGRIFTGTIEYRNGVLSSYRGWFKDNAGNEYHGLFNPNFGLYDPNSYYLYVPASKEVAIKYEIRNGTHQEVGRYQLAGRSWYIQYAQVHYTDGGYTGGGYNGGYSTGSGSGSGSSYNSHEALCRGCNGTGRCQHCGGSGWVNNYKSKCSLCHGTGRCVSCSGRGKIHGNY